MTMGEQPYRTAGLWWWGIPALALALMLLLWWFDGNCPVFLFFNALSDYTGEAFWANVTAMGEPPVVFSLALLLAGRHPRAVWTLVLAALFAGVTVHGLKEWLDVARPPAVLHAGEIHIIGAALGAVSFPSVHTTATFLLAGVVATQVRGRPAWRFAFTAGAVLIGISRMAVGIHWPMDVLVGALIGWCSVALGHSLGPRIRWGVSLDAQRLFAFLLAGAAVNLVLFHRGDYAEARPTELVVGVLALLGAAPALRRLFSRTARADYGEHAGEKEGDPNAGTTPRLAGMALRIAVTVAMCWGVFRSVDVEKLAAAIGGAAPRLLLFALLFHLLGTALAAYRWHLLMRPLGYRLSFGFYLRSYFKGAFFNQALPTSIGGDAVRVLDVARGGVRKRDAFRGVFIDRVLGLVALLVLNLVASAVDPHLLPTDIHLAINLLAGTGLAAFLLMLLLHRISSMRRWRVTRYAGRISGDLLQVLRRPPDAVVQFILSVGVHLLSLVAVLLIGRSVGLDYGLTTFLIIVPPAILLTLIPVSFAGWGVREGALVGLFSLIGADRALVLSMSILYGLVLVVGSLPGLAAYLAGRHRI